MKKLFFTTICLSFVMGLSAQVAAPESEALRQQLAEEWKEHTHQMMLSQGALETEIPLPQYANLAPTSIRQISAADFREQEGQDFPIDTIRYSGPQCINLVLMGDGFTADEYSQFKQYANKCVNNMFSSVPYKDYQEWFNVFFIQVNSNESGASHPGYPEGTCPEGSSLPIQTVDTYFSAAFDYYGIHRLIVVANNKPYELLNAILPDYDIACILANTTEYGGSGGSIMVLTVNSSSNEIFLHELGHTFGKLADEYFAGDFYLGEAPNTSKYNTETTVPWKAWWGKSQVSAFPIGGSAKGNSYFKPVNGTCKMEYLGKSFCPPCRENIIKEIHKKVNMIEDYVPHSASVKPTYEETSVDFEVLYHNVSRKTTIKWILDGEEMATDVATYSLDVSGFEVNARHKLEVQVTDKSSYLAEPVTSTHSWIVRRQESTGIASVSADGTEIEPVEGGVRITTPTYRQVIVYGINGQRYTSRHIVGTTTIPLPKGVYIVEGRKIRL